MTRELLALAHHRFYCVGPADEPCAADQTDYDFADFALEMLTKGES